MPSSVLSAKLIIRLSPSKEKLVSSTLIPSPESRCPFRRRTVCPSSSYFHQGLCPGRRPGCTRRCRCLDHRTACRYRCRLRGCRYECLRSGYRHRSRRTEGHYRDRRQGCRCLPRRKRYRYLSRYRVHRRLQSHKEFQRRLFLRNCHLLRCLRLSFPDC